MDYFCFYSPPDQQNISKTEKQKVKYRFQKMSFPPDPTLAPVGLITILHIIFSCTWLKVLNLAKLWGYSNYYKSFFLFTLFFWKKGRTNGHKLNDSLNNAVFSALPRRYDITTLGNSYYKLFYYFSSPILWLFSVVLFLAVCSEI